jgi:hypothetical protein
MNGVVIIRAGVKRWNYISKVRVRGFESPTT